MFAPLEGFRHAQVRTAYRRGLCSGPKGIVRARTSQTPKKICLVQDNLNTHNASLITKPFPPPKHAGWSKGSMWHYTPKHGSWLDMAESELGVLSSQCLGRRIPDKQTLIGEVAAWEKDRNKRHTKADWQFTTADARIKLKRLYPRFESFRATSPTLEGAWE